MMDGLRGAVGFLTILGGAAQPDRRAVPWFAPVGAAIGGCVGLAWWGAAELWTPLVAAVLAVAADAMLTGMLHLDGLGDTADGLLPPMERTRRLEVMRDPHAGEFAVVALGMTLLLRVAALAALEPDVVLVVGLWAASRGVMARAVTTLPYARGSNGLASPFTTSRNRSGKLAILTILGAISGMVLAGAAPALALVFASGAVLWFAQRRLGGFTGDVLGAAGVLGETMGLLAAAA